MRLQRIGAGAMGAILLTVLAAGCTDQAAKDAAGRADQAAARAESAAGRAEAAAGRVEAAAKRAEAVADHTGTHLGKALHK